MVLAYRRRRAGMGRRRLRGGRRLPRRGLRARLFRRLVNPTPTFTETFVPNPTFVRPNQGQLFTANIGSLPQYAQYTALYNQYRINWVKIMLVPDFNSSSADGNSAAYNATIPGTGAMGLARIVWAIQDTPLPNPAVGIPANEAVVLQDNGCKVGVIKNKWTCSFKPCVATDINVGQGGLTTQGKMRYKPFLNFTGNPLLETIHYGVQAYITQPISNALPVDYHIYMKINFTLRDPK